MTRRRLTIGVLIVLLAGPALAAQRPVPGQPTTSISGRVTDSEGAVLPGVTVTLVPRDGDGVRQVTVTDASGRFYFSGVRVGRFTIEASLAGFQVIRRDLMATVGELESVNLVFHVASVLESVTVMAAEEAVPVRWNAWMERPGARFAPVSNIQPATEYSFIVHLSGLNYAASGPGVASRTVSTSLGEHLQKWLDEHPDVTESHLTVLLVPDAKALRVTGAASTTLAVSLSKLKAFIRADATTRSASPMADLLTDPDRDFVFGRMQFNLAVQDRFEGIASVGLSIWHGMRPVDELVLSFCVARDPRSRRCSGNRAVAQSLKGIDAARLGAESTTTEPDLALHFIDFPGRQIIGTLRNRQWPATQFVTWSLDISANDLKTRLNSLARELGEIQEPGRRAIGLALYGLLFPAQTARHARLEFENALRPLAANPAFSEDVPPVLFIRSIMTSAADAPFVPAAFLYPPSVRSFIGYHVRTEMPLPLQTYDSGDTCINRWVFLVPDDATQVEENLSVARTALGDTSARWRAGGAKVFGELSSFAEWIDADEDDATPTALAVLSHHEQDGLRFGPEDVIFAENFNRTLSGSIAILSACGTAWPGPGPVVRRLNSSGVVAVIGTTSKVTPQLGAAMLRELAAASENPARSDATSLAVLFRRAQRQLFTNAARDGRDPSDVLKYTLLGHAGIQVCTPAAGTR